MREFAMDQEITHYFEIGEMGIEHALLPEKGLVVAGDAVIGADSHTCTYGALGAFSTGVGSTDMAAGMATGKAWFKVPSAIKFVLTGKPAKWVSGKDVILHIIGMIGVDGALYRSMEFVGDGIKNLTMDDRFSMANMAIEAGAKNGIFPVDELAIRYMKEHSVREYKIYEADEDAEYDEVYEIDLSNLKPTVAFPHLPENTRTIDEVGEVKIDQVVIGSCTNGRIDDLRIAAKILEGRKVAKGMRVIVFPATQAIYLQAMEEGLLATFIKAGAVVSTPTCGPCLGGHMGILAAGERAVATTNRNFVGRMGHVKSEVYLASPAVAAASAVTGKISGPGELGL
jgi:3-isopropylmalate/(R)-2-methylmalate dehydratase large subunit